MSARPQWKLPTPDPRPGRYYVTIRDGERWAFLAGPYRWHSEALANVGRINNLAQEANPAQAAFASFGTSHYEGSRTPRTIFPV